MSFLWWLLFLIPASYGTFFHWTNGSATGSATLTWQLTDYCTTPNVLTNITLVRVPRTNSALDPTCGYTLPDLTGKLAFIPSATCTASAPCCNMMSVVLAVKQAGGLGVIIQGTAYNVGVNQVPPITNTVMDFYCIGVLSATNVDKALTSTSGFTVMVDHLQPALDSAQLSVLLQIYNQAQFPTDWPVQTIPDPCLGTSPTVPSRNVWKGITCHDRQGNITRLMFSFPILGDLPNEFCALNSLLQLTIEDDATFTGLPNPICGWSMLFQLTITGTSLSQIDTSLYTLPSLSNLDLSNNHLTGPFPTEFGTNLYGILLQGNAFTGPINATTFPPFLSLLNVGQNQLTGLIPDFTLLSQLGSVDFSDNMFENFSEPMGTYDPDPNLGMTPPPMTTMTFSFNHLVEFPESLVAFLPNLQYLYLDHNSLTSIPDLNGLQHLSTLDVSFNYLNGTLAIPDQLQFFKAANNSLTAITGGVSLQLLDLTTNFISQLPTGSGTFNSIQTLSVGNNKLETLRFDDYNSLITADFSNNFISGTLTEWVLPSSIYSLDLSNNNLTGFVPNSLLGKLMVMRLNGNPLSAGSSTALPPQVVFGFDVTIAYSDRGMECPTYRIKDKKQSEFGIDPSYHNYQFCRCLPNFYRIGSPNVTDRCVTCLAHAICPGKEHPLTHELNVNILPSTGYYPIPDDQVPYPIEMVECRFGVVLAIDPQNPCNPLAETYIAAALDVHRPTTMGPNAVKLNRFSCSSGYSDRLCSRCQAGWFRKEGRCLKCNNRAEYPLFLIAIVIIFLCACFYMTIRTPVDTSTTSINPDGWTFEPKQRIFDFIPLVLHFFQTSTIVLVKLDALDVVQTLNSLLVTASFSTPQSGIGFECGLPVFQGFVTQYLAVVIFPPVLALVLVVFFIGRLIHKKYHAEEINWNLTFYQYIYGIGSMFEAIHFPLVTYVLGVFQCTKDPYSGISYFTDHPYLRCDSISPAGKVFPLLFYPIGLVGFFIGLGVYLHYSPSDVKESEPILQSFAFFFIRFKPDRVASGVFFIFVNLSLSLVVGLMEANTDVFPTLVVLILIVDFFFITVFQPYLQPRYNKVRSVNDLVSLLLFVNNLIYSSTSQFPKRSASPATIYIGLNAGMILFYLYHLYRIIKVHRTEGRLVRANSGAVDPHRADLHNRKHLELADIKTRKHTNIDPPSTSTSESHAYTPVTTNPPVTEASETSTHSPLPIISEHEATTDFTPDQSSKAFSPDTTNADTNTAASGTGLVFTENPLADRSGGSFSNETPPSPSSKE